MPETTETATLHRPVDEVFHDVSSYETDKPDLVDAAGKPGFFMIGKAAIRGMNDTLGR